MSSAKRQKAIVKREKARARYNPRTGGFLGIELKFLDTGDDNSVIAKPTDASGGELPPSTGCTGCLSAPAQGDSQNERIGKNITVKSFYVNGRIEPTLQQDEADAGSFPLVYIALVQDKQTNAATIVSENVFENPIGEENLNGKPLRNLELSSRYRILDQVTLDWSSCAIAFNDNTQMGSMNGPQLFFKLGWRGNMPIAFNTGTTANVSAVVDNSVHLIAYSIVSAFAPQIAYQCRMRYVG